ncbi:hypothetical protein [Endozoicomonas sp. ALB032]|uniref:hypothetical protein n=1 Tax=Endozoicomonas sp. ALB032 TaxID=3403082 RepID=UPI003BB76262
MSLNAKQTTETELDHIRDTLTGIVSYASKTRAEMHQGFAQIDECFEQVDKRFEEVDKRFEEVDKRFEQVDKRFDQVDKRFDQQGKEIAALKADNVEIKESLKLILSRLPS